MAKKSKPSKPGVKVTPEEYRSMAQEAAPKAAVLKNSLFAFLIGGMICSIGQLIINAFHLYGGFPLEDARTAGTVTLIAVAMLLTGFGWYDDIVKVGGAGAIVPVTGFANSMVAPAMEYKREGLIAGLGVKLFTVAGPVLVYGISAAFFAGFIYYIIMLLF